MRNEKWRLTVGVMVVALLAGCLAGCQSSDSARRVSNNQSDSGRPRVVATTNIVGDVARQIGGNRIELTILMGVGQDPHTYVPTPGDVAAVHDAQVIIANGAGLEVFLDELLTNAGGNALVVYVSEGIELRAMSDEDVEDHADEGATQPGQEDDHEHTGGDPHVWLDVSNVIHWVRKIQQQLTALDPQSEAHYAAAAASYIKELEELDQWIIDQVSRIPEDRRKLVTNHPAFGYFADRYGLQQVGAVYPLSPSTEPSAQDLAALQDMVRRLGVPAIFTESTVNPKLAEQVANDAGIKLVSLYSGSLGGPGSGAESYLGLMRFDTNAIVSALAP